MPQPCEAAPTGLPAYQTHGIRSSHLRQRPLTCIISPQTCPRTGVCTSEGAREAPYYRKSFKLSTCPPAAQPVPLRAHHTRDYSHYILSSSQADRLPCIAELPPARRERVCCCSYPHSSSSSVSPTFTLLAPPPSIDPSSTTATHPSHLPRANFLPTPIAILLIHLTSPTSASVHPHCAARTRPSPLARKFTLCLVQSTIIHTPTHNRSHASRSRARARPHTAR